MKTYTPSSHHDDDTGARLRRIQNRILDGIEQTLDDLMQTDAERIAIVAARAAAPLSCPQAMCKRAKRCRRTPCAMQKDLTLRSRFT